MTANDVISEAVVIYNDEDYVRLSLTDWYRFLNDALDQLILVRPDANPTTGTFVLSSGTKQSLPSGALKLIDIIRNMGTDGVTAGAPIIKVMRKVLDQSLSTWHSATGQSEIEVYTYDKDNPKTFYVSPPNDGTGYLESVYSTTHTAITALTDTISLDQIFKDPLLSHTLYRAWLVDTDDTEAFNRAEYFRQQFYHALGVDVQSTENVKPNRENE